MRRSSILAFAVLAALAAGALTSASASAELPEYMVCTKIVKADHAYSGHYTSASCDEESKVEGGGEYELERGFGRKATFAARSGRMVLATSGVAAEMECKTSSTTGEFAGSKEARDVVITANGCEWNGTRCNSPGLRAGRIVTSALVGEFGYLAGRGSDDPTIGLRLTEETAQYVAVFECEGAEVRTQGPIFTEVGGDVNIVSSESTYYFRQSEGMQQYTSFEGGLPNGEWHWEFDVGRGWEPEGGDPSALELTAVANTGAFEIKA
ncbi:MAG TPA: hypothetical protein VKV16_00140 [Solirubrobacteraceae bacterium]|nr:hypothetical protein [Solirubrobacteraceae bacterium]